MRLVAQHRHEPPDWRKPSKLLQSLAETNCGQTASSAKLPDAQGGSSPPAWRATAGLCPAPASAGRNGIRHSVQRRHRGSAQALRSQSAVETTARPYRHLILLDSRWTRARLAAGRTTAPYGRDRTRAMTGAAPGNRTGSECVFMPNRQPGWLINRDAANGQPPKPQRPLGI